MKRLNALAALAVLATRPVGAQTPTQTTIRVASNASDDVTPLLYAKKTGMFAAAGLDVELTRMNSGAAVSAGVLGGSIDIGKSSVVTLIAAHARGLPIEIVAPGALWISTAPIAGLLVKKDGPVMSARDLVGKTVVVAALGDLNDISTRAWVDQNGGDSRAVHFLEVPGSAALAALVAGRVDGVNIGNPEFSTMLSSGQVRLLGHPDDAIAKRFLVSAYFASSTYVAQNATAVTNFARVLRAAASYTNTHPAETLPITAEFWGIEPAVLASMARDTIGLSVDPREIQPLIDTTVKYAEIGLTFDAREMISRIVQTR